MTQHELTELADANENEDLDGNYTRLAEKALRIALLLASVENAEQIELRHWARAQAITERWREGLHALLTQLEEQGVSREREIEDRIFEIVCKLGSATPSDITENIRAMDSNTAARILNCMAMAGRVIVAEITRKGTPRYSLPGA